MEQTPPPRLDPLALAFFGATLALLAGLLLYVFFFKAPEPATPAWSFDVVDQVRRKLAALTDRAADKPAAKPAVSPAAKPPASPAAKAPPSPAAVPAPKPEARPATPPTAAGTGVVLQAGRTWRYAVVVEPPAWRDITLTYRTQREGAGVGVLTDFVYAGGKMNFHLGIFAPGHASHANTRFPGFFMHASYFRLPLLAGQRFSWEWPWQGGSGAGRIKRYEGVVARWEDVQVPAGTFPAAVIVADLYYIEAGKIQAQARETIWYAPKAFQTVKVVRDGATPDEASRRIVAELAEFR